MIGWLALIFLIPIMIGIGMHGVGLWFTKVESLEKKRLLQIDIGPLPPLPLQFSWSWFPVCLCGGVSLAFGWMGLDFWRISDKVPFFLLAFVFVMGLGIFLFFSCLVFAWRKLFSVGFVLSDKGFVYQGNDIAWNDVIAIERIWLGHGATVIRFELNAPMCKYLGLFPTARISVNSFHVQDAAGLYGYCCRFLRLHKQNAI